MKKISRLVRALADIFWQPKHPCASIVLPAKNCEKTIAAAVKAAKKSRFCAEIIVVDGHSTDRTAKRAEQSGARVIFQSKKQYPGKGIAMADGLQACRFEIVAFVDADIQNISTGPINELIEPLVLGDADFVKAHYGKKRGRVTELAAKPLLNLFFPEAARFGYPLSGEMAGKKRWLEKIRFEKDWGVDVGILLDLLHSKARVVEVNLDMKVHPQKRLEDLGPMAYQVAHAILKRAKAWGRLANVADLESLEDVEEALEHAMQHAHARRLRFKNQKTHDHYTAHA